MVNKHTTKRDQYSLSRDGVTTVAGYTPFLMIPRDRLRQVNSADSDTCGSGNSRARSFFRMRRRLPG